MLELGSRVNFHSHTVFSDGTLMPAGLVYEAVAREHAALCITDHADGSNLEEILEKLTRFLRDQGPTLPIPVYPGVELSYLAPSIIEKYAQRARQHGAKIVLVHGETPAESAVPKGTNHAALQCKGLVDVLAHPGLITEEDAILAKVNDIYLELTPRRGHREGNRHVARLAKEFGAKLIVNSDAHSEKDLITQAEAFELAKEAGLKSAEALIVVKDNAQELLKRIASR